MYIILWEYIIKPEQQTEFEKIYGSHGDWARLFQQADGYLGTELLHDSEIPERYITIDRWVSPEAFNSFQNKFHAEYEAMDARCGDLTEREVRLGTGSLISSPS